MQTKKAPMVKIQFLIPEDFEKPLNQILNDRKHILKSFVYIDIFRAGLEALSVKPLPVPTNKPTQKGKVKK